MRGSSEGTVSEPAGAVRAPLPRREAFLTRLAHRLSDVFAPIFVTSLVWGVLSLRLAPDAGLGWINALLGVLFFVFIPLLVPYLYVRRGLDSFHVTKRELRLLPLVVAFSGYLFYWLLLEFVLEVRPLATILAACIWVSVVVGLVTARWKISIHMSGNAVGLTTLSLVFPWAVLLFLLHVPVGWARIHLNAHTPAQVLVGTAVGTVGPLVYFWFFPIA